jgi:hypothetical protein
MSNEVNTQPNFQHIGKSFYLVRTQAGFRQALKMWYGENKRYKGKLVGFPKTYPSIVTFSHAYAGFDFVCATCLHVNVFNNVLNKE